MKKLVKSKATLVAIPTLALLSGLGCAPAATTPATTTAANPTVAAGVSGAISTIESQIKTANLASYSATNAQKFRVNGSNSTAHSRSATSMSSTDWTTENSNITNLKCGSGWTGSNCGVGVTTDSSPALWTKDMLDPAFQNASNDGNDPASVGLMGRFASAVGQACFLGSQIGTSVPAAGTLSVTITDASLVTGNTACGTNFTAATFGGLPVTLTLTVTDVSSAGSNMFDRKISIAMGNSTITFYIKNDGNVARVMTTENHQVADGVGSHKYTYLNRYIAEYTQSTGIARFEGIEHGFPLADGGSTGFYFYRIHVNAGTNEVRVLGENGGSQCSVNTGSSNECVAAGGTVQVANSTMLGINGNFKQNNASVEVLSRASGVVVWDKIGCVDMSTALVASGTTGACSDRALDLNSSSVSLVNTTVLGSSLATWKTDETIGALSFDDTTIFSAGPTN